MELSNLLQSKSWLIEKYSTDLQHPLSDSVKKLILISDYASKHIQLLKTLLLHDECTTLWSREDYFQDLKKISFDLTQPAYFRALRQWRHTHLMRLLLLEISDTIDTVDVMNAWSDCADALILHTLNYCQHLLYSRYGSPCDKKGHHVDLITLAMGKLGGRELNYSSDIDLIFAYTEVGETNGEERIDNQVYFSKIIQQFAKTLQNITPDGFVFRVDLRLRPNGDSGPLVTSLAGMETYYQEQGRDWERYAMVKARVITESSDIVPSWFKRLIIPFVYRRYVDFSVIESLRSMKSMIEREVELNPRLNDIKRGKGGIREIEFIVQNFQLIRAGRLPQLQKQNTLAALAVLKQENLLPHAEVLKQAYIFLRQLENALQSLNDQQTHSLPEEQIKQEQITLAMGFASWEQLITKLNKYQRIVSYAFHSVLGNVQGYEDEKRLLTHQLSSLWQGHAEPTMAINLLTSLGYANATHCYQMIHAFRHSPRCKRLTQSARMRLDRFIVVLLTELSVVEKTDEVLLQVMRLLENIVGRSAYLALLTENPHVLIELLFYFAHSPFITSLLVTQPFLLEVLLDQDQEWKPPSLHQLRRVLVEKLAHQQDIELQEEILRQFKLTHWLMAARAELCGFCKAVRIGQFLSDVAQVILNHVVFIASQQLSVRYPEMKQVASRFAIIAYGKLGSREMNYTSDLDLVFLHSVSSNDEALITRLTQKIVHMLTTRSQSGILYAVDTRLRPSGSVGLLVSPIGAFIEYQKKQAWTWEHQALLKARFLTENIKMKLAFFQLKKEILISTREKATLREDISAMRVKMGQHQARDPIAMSLLNLEFLIQFLVLRLGDPFLARHTHPLNQLSYLYLKSILNKPQYLTLKKMYRKLHQLVHQNVLRPEVVDNQVIYEAIQTVYNEFLASEL